MGSLRLLKKPLANTLNYKTWYQSTNPYFGSNASCEHTYNPNLSVEHSHSKYIPLILTPRNFAYKFGINFNTNSKLHGPGAFKGGDKNSDIAENTNSTENLSGGAEELDDKSPLKEQVEKLYEAIYYKMSESTSIKSVNNSSLEKLEAEQKLNEAMMKKKNTRRVSNAKQAVSRKLSVITSKETHEEKPEAAEAQPEVKTLHLDVANIFELEAMRQTPKLLALQPLRPRVSVKESVHSIFDMYDSSSPNRQDLFGFSDGKGKRSQSTVLNKEKSNISQGSAKNSNNRVKFNME